MEVNLETGGLQASGSSSGCLIMFSFTWKGFEATSRPPFRLILELYTCRDPPRGLEGLWGCRAGEHLIQRDWSFVGLAQGQG